MRIFSKQSKVVLAIAYAFGFNATSSADMVSSSWTDTKTCHTNGVLIDCVTGERIPTNVSELCPDRRNEPIYGKPCDYRFTTLKFHAVKLQHSYDGHGFKNGAQFVAAYGMNDNGSIVGEAMTITGERHATSVEVGPRYPENIYFSNHGIARRSSSLRAIANNYFMVGTAQAAIGSASYQATAWDSQYGRHIALRGLTGKTGVATGIGKSYNQRLFVSGYDVWPVSSGGDGKVHAFLWSWHGPGYEGINVLGKKGQTSRGLDVNDRGYVVGYYVAGGVGQAFQSGAESLEPLPDLGNFESRAIDINNNSWPKTVGYAKNSRGAKQPVVWQKNQMTKLPLLPAKRSGSANAITDAGDVVGDSGDRATIWRDGVVHDLNKLLDKSIAGTLRTAVDINLLGRILVKASDGYYVLIPTSDL